MTPSNLEEPSRRLKWRVSRKYLTIDELYSTPNPRMSSLINLRRDTNIEKDVSIVDGVFVRQLDPHAHEPQISRRQCERRYRAIDELYKVPNFTMPRLIHPRIDTNEPFMVHAWHIRQGSQLSPLNVRFMDMDLGQLSRTENPREVVRKLLHNEPQKEKLAPQSKMFRTQDELHNDPKVLSSQPLSLEDKISEGSPDARTCELHLVQETSIVVDKNGLEERVGDTLEHTKHDEENYIVNVLQESIVGKKNRSDQEINHVSEHAETGGAKAMDIQEPPVVGHNELQWKDDCVLEPDNIRGDNVFDVDDASDIVCCQCLCGDNEAELVLCNCCTLGYHTFCARPILPCVPNGLWICSQCSGLPQTPSLPESDIMNFFRIEHFNTEGLVSNIKHIGKKRKRGKSTTWSHKSRKQWLPYVPSKDKSKRLEQLGSLSRAMQYLNLVFVDDLVYASHLDLRFANQATLEKTEVQILLKGNVEIWKMCKAMHRRGECPPLKVVYDYEQGYMVIADDTIEDKTFICEYTGLVDFSKNRELDDSNCTMNLLITNDEHKDLVICQNEYSNVSHFLSGINNHKKESKKKQNCTFIRCSVGGECRIFVVSIRRIKAGTALYCNYNAGVSVNTYPTQNFV